MTVTISPDGSAVRRPRSPSTVRPRPFQIEGSSAGRHPNLFS
jgi:hypothetical protein